MGPRDVLIGGLYWEHARQPCRMLCGLKYTSRGEGRGMAKEDAALADARDHVRDRGSSP